MKKQLVFGMGTGRCGTVSLYRLLNSQKNSFFTHESKPLLTWNFDKKKIDDKLKKLLNKKQIYAGDVNSCYLPYVEYLCKNFPSVKIVILKRSKQDIVKSFLNQTNVFNWNHWVDHDGTKWRKSKMWDPMFPKYKITSKEKAIGRYWNEYYKRAKDLIKKYPKNIRIFKTTDLNSETSVKKLLDFCNIDEKDQRVIPNIRENQFGSLIRFVKYFFWRADRL